MSSSETDFWSRIDSEQPREDVDERPESSHPESSRHESSRPESSRPESNTHGSSSQQKKPAPRQTAAHGASDSHKRTAEPTADVVRPADSGSSKSKSQRIREYLSEHPEARNRDAVEALASYGVTAADVSNVKTQLRKKEEKQKRAKARVQSPTATAPSASTEPASRRAAAPAPVAKSTPATGEVAMGEIEAGLAFIENAGGLQRARQIIDLIARIREVNLG